MPEETEQISVDAEQVMGLMQRLYPTEFAHVMATVEAAYWREKAESNGAAKKK